MRLQILSDLHTEFFTSASAVRAFCEGLLTDADALIIAGDLGLLNPKLPTPDNADGSTSSDLLELALNIFCNRYESVIYVPGNHEYYFFNFMDADTELKKLQQRHLNLSTDIDPFSATLKSGLNIHCTTLWFEPDPNHVMHWRGMSDAYYIGEEANREGYSIPSSPTLFEQRGQNAVAYLEQHVEPGDIVVTHHLPLWSIVLPRYKHDMLTHFFVNEDANVVLKQRPGLWVCGHTHGSVDKLVGSTKVVCNPYGYHRGEHNSHFDRTLVLII